MKMKKTLSLLMAVILAFGLLTGCSSKSSNQSTGQETGQKTNQETGQSAGQSTSQETGNKADDNSSDDKFNVVVVINNNLGDKTISDLAWSGAQRAAKDFNMNVKVIELLGDATKQVPTLTELAESGEYDVIVAGLFNLKEAVEEVARNYPEQKFISYDTELNFADGGLDNAYSVMARQNEAAFLGGAVAAYFTQSGYEGTNKEKIIGFVGGGENTAVNDFLLGYIAGATYVDPEVKVLISYVGNFTDSAKAKELTLAQYQQGADIVFSVASGAGMGVLDAAKESGKFAIGVDQDQATLKIENGDDATANQIVTSVIKKMDNIVYDALKGAVEGTLAWGTHEYVGLADDSMGLAENEIYNRLVSEDVRKTAQSLREDIISGKITVDTALGKSTDEIKAIREKVKP